MENLYNSGIDCWLTRVRKVEQLCNIPSYSKYYKKEFVGNSIQKRVRSLFDRFWLDEIKNVKADVNGINHNKLRFYSTLKSSFSRETYLDLVQSRTQRSFLTRLRCSAHHLEIEKLRYSTPPTPIEMRLCKFCTSEKVGDKEHFLMDCKTFNTKRECFKGKMSSLIPHFRNMSKTN